MSDTPKRGLTRREVLKTSGQVAVASALAGMAVPYVHAGESNTIQLALVGCGGRGGGAAEDALASKNGPTKLVALADVFPGKLKEKSEHFSRNLAKQTDLPKERQFLGFDAYKHAMDCLKPGDVVILTTPPAFRWVHFTYAISKGLNVFMEKPITVDGPSTRRMLKLGEEAKNKNLKVGVGLMCRHCPARGEMFKKIQDGMIGDITLLRAYRQHNPVAFFESAPKPDGITELLYQVQRFHSFLWASGGCYSDFYIHNIDECCWMKNDWPVEASGSGGRHFRGNSIDQNFDSYSVEYTFRDGTKLLLEGRCMKGCDQQFASLAHGTKGSAIISSNSHWPSRCRLLKSQHCSSDPAVQKKSQKDIIWKCGKEPGSDNPYRVEWDDLLAAIRQDKPYNEVERGAKASLVTAMGRAAAHTGHAITFDEMLNSEQEFAPEVDKLAMDSPAPLRAGPNGRYPVPEPGRKGKREF